MELIWFLRNRVAHGKPCLDVPRFAFQVLHVSREHLRAWSTPVGLSPLVEWTIHLSFSVVACLCRDHSGHILWAASSILLALDALVGEFKATCLAVRVASSHLFSDIIVEGDSSMVCGTLKDPTICRWQVDSLIQNQLLYVSLFLSCVWLSVPRSANSLSHLIAQWATSSKFEGDIPLRQAHGSSPWVYEGFDPPWLSLFLLFFELCLMAVCVVFNKNGLVFAPKKKKLASLST